ncbi:hypothetical protein F7725_015247 [Dissostichus mawsoni]|uniref:Uncharacterized protein n=1 Tax=Dissostichus mawsoni TaxID=36200 RepID=A0A7J5YH93_DISMA|nr:hypothetical protein F7725_015247 [Dissostichus mawsoni]
MRNLPDALLGVAAGRRASDAPPGRDEVGVAPGVREGVGRAAGTAATLEGRRLFLLILLELHLITGSRLMPTVRMMVNHSEGEWCGEDDVDPSTVDVDDKNERGGGDDGEGLVVGGGFSVLPHGLKEGSVGDEEDDERDKDTVEQADEEVLVVEKRSQLSGESVEEGVPEVNQCEGEVLEEEVTQELAHSDVGPAPVHQQEALQFIGALTLDHVDVVGSVSDGQRHGFLVLLHQTHHVTLLLGSDAAADDSLALTGHVHKGWWEALSFPDAADAGDGVLLLFGGVSVRHGDLRLFVSPGPGFVICRADVFVTQAQRPQGGVGKDLKHKRHNQKSEIRVPSTETAAHMNASWRNVTVRMRRKQTHIQIRLGSFFVFGLRGKSLVDDGVSSFAVEADTTIRKLH